MIQLKERVGQPHGEGSAWKKKDLVVLAWRKEDAPAE